MDIKELNWRGIKGTEDFVPVVSVGDGGGYDWNVLEAWWSPSLRKFFWLSDSGCSCNALGDSVTSVGDFEAGDRDALTSAVRAWHDAAYSPTTPSEKLADLASVKTFITTT